MLRAGLVPKGVPRWSLSPCGRGVPDGNTVFHYSKPSGVMQASSYDFEKKKG